MTEDVINAMKLLVEWRIMKNMCEDRTSCKECGYFNNKSCDLISTRAMLDAVANVFQTYLDAQYADKQ